MTTIPAKSSAVEFEELVIPQLDALLRTATRLTRDADAAEDLVQDTLLKGFRFFDRFECDSNFKAWIFKILTNTFVNNYRQNQRRGLELNAEVARDTAAVDTFDQRSIEAPTFGEREEAIFELVDDEVRLALLDLPEQMRIVFLLAVIEDLKYREIAVILDVPVGTVMSRLFRARAMLKVRLSHYAEATGCVRP